MVQPRALPLDGLGWLRRGLAPPQPARCPVEQADCQADLNHAVMVQMNCEASMKRCGRDSAIRGALYRRPGHIGPRARRRKDAAIEQVVKAASQSADLDVIQQIAKGLGDGVAGI